MRLPFKKIEFDILLAISVITIIVVILTSVAGYSGVSADTSANAANAGTANNEAPRLEPEKLWPEYMKGKSVIDEMDKNR